MANNRSPLKIQIPNQDWKNLTENKAEIIIN
jgi:hypothetical protein